MDKANTDLSALSLPELASRLRDVDTMRTPLGWPTESAVTKSSIERRIIEIVTADPGDGRAGDAGQRIHCDLELKVRSADRPSVKSSDLDLRPGALFVSVDAPFTVGEPVELEVETENHYRLRVRGNVGWVAERSKAHPAGVAITFQAVAGDAAERRLHRLILELVRNRVER
ncbi:MAG TPA: PilZ domain-containing protein [Kofleriaceae bacterium]|nr:PilZ domain-containing protein [Kofleriaceae bacterium]